LPPEPAGTLAEALRHRFGRFPFRSNYAGGIVISLQDGHTIFESNADRPLTPASTMKVLTSAAIIDKLGPDWRFRTPFLADAPPVGGTIAGNLYVRGVCQPDLVVEKFQEIGAGLLGGGVREVQGDVIADLHYFDGEERPPEWPGGGSVRAYSAPISALTGNFSSVRVTVHPGPAVGAPAVVLVEPPADAVAVSANVRTVTSGRSSVHAMRTLHRAADGTLTNRISVSGRIPISAGPWEMFLTIEDPAGVAVSAVKHSLQDAGIVVRGGTRLGPSPAGAVPVFTLISKPLAEIVRDMNKSSNNFIAEMLQRTLGAEVYGPPASREKGAQAVAGFLRTCGIDPGPFTLTDGSGLSRSNRVSASALARILVRMWGDPRIGTFFLDSLPVGGMDGTLKGRMFGPARGRVRAKTGYIEGVTALAGYVPDTREGPVAFAFIVNGASHPRTVRALDELCNLLCAPGKPVEASPTVVSRNAR
jgi:D-alanyl-D-alanine carboxypeptidase/D-alanyl-D-alanine-endopeptidase (penicillin-binding protein 4)